MNEEEEVLAPERDDPERRLAGIVVHGHGRISEAQGQRLALVVQVADRRAQRGLGLGGGQLRGGPLIEPLDGQRRALGAQAKVLCSASGDFGRQAARLTVSGRDPTVCIREFLGVPADASIPSCWEAARNNALTCVLPDGRVNIVDLPR